MKNPSRLEKIRRALALTGAIFLLLLYLAALVAAFIDKSQSRSLLMAAIFATFFFAFILYAASILLKLSHRDSGADES